MARPEEPLLKALVPHPRHTRASISFPFLEKGYGGFGPDDFPEEMQSKLYTLRPGTCLPLHVFLFMSIIDSQQFIVFTYREWGFLAGVQGGGGQWDGMDGDFSLYNLVYCFTYYFPESLYSYCFLKGSSRFWNKNMLVAVSADLIKSGRLARNREL